jgi:hypothetical protein
VKEPCTTRRLAPELMTAGALVVVVPEKMREPSRAR